MREVETQQRGGPAPEGRPGPHGGISWRTRAVALAGGVAAGILAAGIVLVVHGGGPSSGTRVTGAIRPLPAPQDRPAPAFSLPALEGGRRYSLQSFSGHVLVLNVWASWCTACRSEAPELRSLWSEFRARGVRFLGVDNRDARGPAVGFDRRFGLPYPSVFDPQGEVAFAYGAVGLPTTFVVDPRGIIRYEVVGEIDPASFRQALDGLLAGRVPAVRATAPAVGTVGTVGAAGTGA